MGAEEQPAVLQKFQRCAGTFGQAPAAEGLRAQFAPKEVQLVEDDGGRPVFLLPLGRRGVAAALAALVAAEAVECRVHSVRLGESIKEDSSSHGVEWLDVLLSVTLLPPSFELEEGDEAAPALAVLVAHWEELWDELKEEATGQAASGPEELGHAQRGSTACGPFAAELQAGWWQVQAQTSSRSARADARDASAGSEAGAEGGNPRDRIFELVLPSDWQLEAPEPPGLSCTLFRYQRRCLAWLKWRESLGSSVPGSTAPVDQAAGVGAGMQGDSRSRKLALAQTNLRWQPLSLPSGLRAWCSPGGGCLRPSAVTPPLPEVPGGLLCDEMGLGKTVEMMALFLANPPPEGLRARALQHQPSGQAAEAADGASWGDEDGGATARGGGSHEPPQNGGAANGQRIKAPAPAAAPCAGTLVVCPPALLQQWQSELSNHAHGALVVEVYDGLRGLERAAEAEGKGRRLKPAQREMELYQRLLQGEEVEAGFDAAAEAAAAARRLQEADVVLTSFDVLRAEVYFMPSTRSFRRPKKYAVPHCPLLQVRWWRLVIDEAQMVGPLSAAGTMAERIKAVHRWCVTGTPMGAHKNELTDIHALLSTLQHQPFEDAATWRRLVAEPLAAGVGPAARQAWSLLDTVLAPLMWRNTKGVVAQEFHLPPRSLHPVWLAFQPGERAFYEQVVEKTREARQQLEEFRRRQELGSDEDDDEGGGGGKRSTPAALRTRKRRQAKQGERLESAAVENISQLRLACIHPQLTRVWRDMQAEAQLGIGAALSMEEIMQRLVEGAQNDLQEAERSLCAHLNTLAMRLLAKAEAVPVGGGGGQAAADELAALPSAELGEGAPGSPPPAKRARKSRGGFDALGREALRARALLCLEQSFRVAEKGIAAMDVGMDQLKGMPDIEAASTSTVNAWKRLQINTATQLCKLHAAAGREEEARRMELDARDKVGYLRSQAEMELTSAQQRLEQVQGAAEEARRAFRLHWKEAAERGFGPWGITSDASRWLSGLEAAYEEARELEERELEAQEGKIKAMLGRRVQAALDDVEKQLHGELTQLDRYVGEQHAAAGCRQLAREQHSWECAQAATGGGSNKGAGGSNGGISAAEAAVVAGGVRALWELLKLLPDFRRKTLLVQHVAVFSKLMAEEGEKKAAEAARRRAEAEAQRAAAAAAAGLEPEVVEVGDEEAAAGPQPQPRGPSPKQGDPHTDGQQGHAGSQERQPEAAAAPAPQELAAVLAAVDARRDFAPASCWLGRIKGHVFKLGPSGLGYYRDAPPVVEASLAQLHIVAAAVGRALQEHQRRLSKAAGPEAELFAALSLDAVEAKLESVKQQIQLARALKEQHVAERTLALKAALQADLDADLQAAAELPPLPVGGSADKLAREVERLKEEALSLLHRKRYMASRVSEARQLQPAAGAGVGGSDAPAQQGQQEQQEQQEQREQREQQQETGLDEGQRGAGRREEHAGEQQEQQLQQLAGRELQAAPQPGEEHAEQQQGAGRSGAATGAAAATTACGASGGSSGPPAGGALPGSQGAGPSGSVAQGGAHGAHHAKGVECPVCLCTVPAGHDIHVFSACGHAFCKDCAAKLVLLQGMCAVCRHKVVPSQVFRVAAGGARPANAGDPEFEALGRIQPQGEWSAKVEALLRRLLHMQTTAPAEKALIFSQFPEALKLVALALQTNGIRFVQLLGGRVAARKAVASFRDDEEVRVFLLSHRVGAAGLTLVRASRVFLLEPALDPSIEQQAVARVHRIGQQRPVVVTRLLVQGSIEARVLAMQEAKHALFSGADGGAEDTAELATTVEAPVRAETLDGEDLRGLLEDM